VRCGIFGKLRTGGLPENLFVKDPGKISGEIIFRKNLGMLIFTRVKIFTNGISLKEKSSDLVRSWGVLVIRVLGI
jgi:hypothetical protein